MFIAKSDNILVRIQNSSDKIRIILTFIDPAINTNLKY